MAGIGLELKSILKQSKLITALPRYSYVALLSSAPTLITVLAVFALGWLFYIKFEDYTVVVRFIAIVVYLIATTLIIAGTYQYSFIRYIGDRLYENDLAAVVPAYHGLLLFHLPMAGIVGLLLAVIGLPAGNGSLIVLVLACFVLLNIIWISHHLLIGMESHYIATLAYLLGYGLAFTLGWMTRDYGITGLLSVFFVGNLLLFVIMQVTIYYQFPSNRLVDFAYFKALPKKYWPYLVVSFFLYLSIWIDKFIFWLTPFVSHPVIGSLRASYVYDVPVLLSYIAAIPGVVVILMKIEGDFQNSYRHYSQAIVKGESLSTIEYYRQAMVTNARDILKGMFKAQFVLVLIIMVLAPEILQTIGMSINHIRLFRLLSIGVALGQVLFLGILDMLNYMDKVRCAMVLTVCLCIFNGVFTYLSLLLGPQFYGLGFNLAILLVDIIGIIQLNQSFHYLNYDLYCLRHY